MHDLFTNFSRITAAALDSFWAFIVASCVVLPWAITGPVFHFSDTWQLVMNTTSSIVTFLMVFLIQSTQNRDTLAIQLKLDELLRGVTGARTEMVNLESLSDDELNRLEQEFRRLRERASRNETSPDNDGHPT
jgi:low affinity Fe/Cu permease